MASPVETAKYKNVTRKSLFYTEYNFYFFDIETVITSSNHMMMRNLLPDEKHAQVFSAANTSAVNILVRPIELTKLC